MTYRKPEAHSFKAWRHEKLVELLDIVGGDGHSILDPYGLVEELQLTPAEAVRLGACAKWHTSDGSPKGTINGDPDLSLFGVYTLPLLTQIATDLEAKKPKGLWPEGRGTQARMLSQMIRQALKVDTTA